MPNNAKQLKKTAASKKSATNSWTGRPILASARISTPKAAANGFHPGTYIVPRGHVSIAVPTFWSLRQTNDDIQVESEASETTVIVTPYKRNANVKSLDARDYPKHFLDN